MNYLAGVTAVIEASSTPKAVADTRWSGKSAKHFGEIRATLTKMATGRSRCMYCEDNDGTDIDHFYPKATYPAKAFDWANYFLACSHCNSNEKRTQFPTDSSGEPLLIDPALEHPLDHLALLPHLGEFASRSPKGAASIEVFNLNRPRLTQGRIDSWVSTDALIARYGAHMMSSDNIAAARTLGAITASSFSMVRTVMTHYALSGIPLLDPETRRLLLLHPELQN